MSKQVAIRAFHSQSGSYKVGEEYPKKDSKPSKEELEHIKKKKLVGSEADLKKGLGGKVKVVGQDEAPEGGTEQNKDKK